MPKQLGQKGALENQEEMRFETWNLSWPIVRTKSSDFGSEVWNQEQTCNLPPMWTIFPSGLFSFFSNLFDFKNRYTNNPVSLGPSGHLFQTIGGCRAQNTSQETCSALLLILRRALPQLHSSLVASRLNDVAAALTPVLGASDVDVEKIVAFGRITTSNRMRIFDVDLFDDFLDQLIFMEKQLTDTD